MVLRPHSPQRGPLQLRYPFGFSLPCMGVGPVLLGLHLSYESGCSFFCKSFVIRLCSGSLQLIIQVDFSKFSGNSKLDQEEGNITSTYSAAIFDPPLCFFSKCF